MTPKIIRAFVLATGFNAIGFSLQTATAVTIPNINEFVADHTGADSNEFVEVYGSASNNYSMFTIVEIEGDGASAGLVDDFILQVGTTNSLGFWVSPFQNNVIENDNMTLLMVRGWRGAVGDDIDTNNDGIIDNPLWDSIWDSVGVLDDSVTGFAYGQTNLDASFDGISNFAPGGASRIPNGTDNNLISEWRRNTFNYSVNAPADWEAFNTPGALNRWVPEPSAVLPGALAALVMSVSRLILKRPLVTKGTVCGGRKWEGTGGEEM